MQDEFYAIAFRKNVYDDLEQLQQDLDVWMEGYNTVRTHSGKYGYGKTPMQTFEEAKHLSMQKQLDLRTVDPPGQVLASTAQGRPLPDPEYGLLGGATQAHAPPDAGAPGRGSDLSTVDDVHTHS